MLYKVLVIGANSLLGTNTIIELLNQGFLVKGFLRNKNKFVGPQHVNLEFFEGDITNIADLNISMSDCQYVVNCAALTDQGGLKYEAYYSVNVQGVKNVFNSALMNKIKRIIHVGTANEFGYGRLGDLGNETREMEYPFNKSYYARSKKEAYSFLISQRNKMDMVFVNPTFMIGAYDSKPSSGKIVLMGLKNKLVFCPPGGKNFVYVKDVARGIGKAIKHGNSGESYLLANENLSFYQFFNILKDQLNTNFYLVRIPKWILLIVGGFGSVLRFFKIKTDLSIENMRALSINSFYSNQKSKEELGVVFNPIDNGIKEAVSWFSNQ